MPSTATLSPLDDRLLSPNEAAKFCGVTRDSIYRWIEEGRFPVIRLTRKLIRIRFSELEKYLNSNTVQGVEN